MEKHLENPAGESLPLAQRWRMENIFRSGVATFKMHLIVTIVFNILVKNILERVLWLKRSDNSFIFALVLIY